MKLVKFVAYAVPVAILSAVAAFGEWFADMLDNAYDVFFGEEKETED